MFAQASVQTKAKVTRGNTSLPVSTLTSLTLFNGHILVLNTCNVFSLAVTGAGHKHAILALPIIVLLITPIRSDSRRLRSGWRGCSSIYCVQTRPVSSCHTLLISGYTSGIQNSFGSDSLSAWQSQGEPLLCCHC